MKAVVYTESGPPEVLKLREVPKPVPHENEILVKIYASPVTAIDMGYTRLPGRTSKGKRLGNYFAGVVEEVGREVKRFKPGDEVYGGDVWSLGTYAEYKCLNEKTVLAAKPANITFEEASAITYEGATALPFLRDRGKIREGHKVLIIGASGSIGSCAVLLAIYFGAEVTGVCAGSKVEYVKSLGVEHVIDYQTEDFTRNGQKYDIIFDTPAKSSFSKCKNSLTGKGRYLTTVPWPRELLNTFWTSFASRKKGMFVPMGLRSKRVKNRDLLFLNEIIEVGKFKPVIDKAFPLEQIVEAHRYVRAGQKKGDVVIRVQESG